GKTSRSLRARGRCGGEEPRGARAISRRAFICVRRAPSYALFSLPLLLRSLLMRFFTAYLDRLDAVYRERPYFVGQRARLLAACYEEPLSAAIQLVVIDLVFLLFAFVFASRRFAIAVFAVMVAGHVGFYWKALHRADAPGSIAFAADTLLRDGLIAMGFVFA